MYTQMRARIYYRINNTIENRNRKEKYFYQVLYKAFIIYFIQLVI